MTRDEWRKLGFDEVVEIAHNRHYYIRGTDRSRVARSFRLLIGQVILGGHDLRWVAFLDEQVDVGGRLAWTANFDLHPSYSDEGDQFCLDDAVRALAVLLGL